MRVAALGLALCAALGAPATAQAGPGPPLRPFPHQPTVASSDPISDGSRYFVINAAPGVIRIYDTARHESHDMRVPERCVARDATPGVALVACPNLSPYGGERPFILRLRERRFGPMRGSDPKAPLEFWRAIGREWVAADADAQSKPVAVYLNWRTGERSSDGEPRSPGRGHLDLDDPDLRPYPRGIVDRAGSRALRISERGGLQLVRPGPDVRLSRVPSSAARVSAGIASWPESTRVVRAYDERRRVRSGWILPDDARFLAVAHTRTHVLVGARDDFNAPPRLHWARLRR